MKVKRLSGASATYAREVPVFGIPVRFETDDAEVMGTLEGAFDAWDSIRSDPDLRSSTTARFTIAVEPANDDSQEDNRVKFEMLRHDRVVASVGRSVGIADAACRCVTACVTRSLVADPERFQHMFVEALTLALVTRLDRQPFHAAAIVRSQSALLLAGPSGIGKSTIAYAALRSGLLILAEDAVFIQLTPRLRVWGKPGPLRLRASAKQHFAELADAPVRRMENGKRKIIINLSESQLALVAERAGLCLLTRHAGAAQVERLDTAEILAELSTPDEPGFDVFAESIGERLAPIAKGGSWRLNLSSDPWDALPGIYQMLDELDAEP